MVSGDNSDEATGGEKNPSLSSGTEMGSGETAKGPETAAGADELASTRKETADRVLDEMTKFPASVVLVEDEFMVRRGLVRRLSGMYTNVNAFESAEKFLASFYDEGSGEILFIPDVVCSDTNLPEMSGAQLFAKITEILDRHNVPAAERPVFIAISGMMHDPENRDSTNYYTGHNIAMFSKPVTAEQLQGKIKELLEARKVEKK